MKIVTDAGMWDIRIPNGTVYTHSLSPNRTLAGLAIRGDGAFSLDANETTHFAHKDFVIVQSETRWRSSHSSFRYKTLESS